MNSNPKKKKLCLVLPSVSPGGLERVMTDLAWYISKSESIELNLISLSKGDFFYPLPAKIKTFSPSFSLEEIPRPIYLLKLILWVRKQAKKNELDIILTFGGKFNSFVLLSVLGLKIHTYISDRSRPTISYGHFLDWLNPIMYKRAAGIIAQTNQAKVIMQKRVGHPNIIVIGNPLKISETENDLKENIILNVGRFIPSKQQDLLVRFFARIEAKDWKLLFLGDGQTLNSVKKATYDLGLDKKVEFLGFVQDISRVYKKCKIFAFTSRSEGFPNALGEAMANSMACISFNCEAGPADLIDNGVNGFLIQENEHEMFIEKLKLLMEDENLRNEFGTRARDKVTKFNQEYICKSYLQFVTGQ